MSFADELDILKGEIDAASDRLERRLPGDERQKRMLRRILSCCSSNIYNHVDMVDELLPELQRLSARFGGNDDVLNLLCAILAWVHAPYDQIITGVVLAPSSSHTAAQYRLRGRYRIRRALQLDRADLIELVRPWIVEAARGVLDGLDMDAFDVCVNR